MPAVASGCEKCCGWS